MSLGRRCLLSSKLKGPTSFIILYPYEMQLSIYRNEANSYNYENKFIRYNNFYVGVYFLTEKQNYVAGSEMDFKH